VLFASHDLASVSLSLWTIISALPAIAGITW
jgi:hypothetical protein